MTGESPRATEHFVLPADVLLVPVDSLTEERRQFLNARDGDVVLTRAHGRSHSKVVDSAFSKLIESFREARTIVDAVISFSRSHGRDPESTLEAAHPILELLIRSKFLVPEGSDEANPIDASLQEREVWNGLKVIRLVHLFGDSEVYQARTAAGQLVALKLARAPISARIADQIAREAAILTHLDGTLSPRPVQQGVHRGRPYLAIEWRDGLSASRSASHRRSMYGSAGRQRLLTICRGIAQAYADLHCQSVVHGDVHPGNIIISDQEQITLIDFGLGRWLTSDDPALSQSRRGGVDYFFEPEYAQAWLRNTRSLPLSTPLGEQHIVAHLLYRLVTGHPYLNFVADKTLGMQQIATGEAAPFARWSLESWPALESVLGRALSVRPSERFDSMTDFARELQGVALPEATRRRPAAITPTVAGPDSGDLLEHYLARLDPASEVFSLQFPQTPRCSVTYGSAGVAYFLYRLACIREDARLLSWSKLWIEKALADVQPSGDYAFYDSAGQLPRETVGSVALYHTLSGVCATQLLIGHAMGDIAAQADATTHFLRAIAAPCQNIDLTLGRSGVLLGCALQLEAVGVENEALRNAGDTEFDGIWAEIELKADIAHERDFRFTGIAHGWAGVLYASLTWCRASGRPLPATLVDRLDQLSRRAVRRNGGLAWERKVRAAGRNNPADYLLSWCNGTGGMIFLWTQAYQLTSEQRYLDLAQGAAQDVVSASDPVTQLCCGRAGQAYGVLNLYKHTKEKKWLELAQGMLTEVLSATTLPSPRVTPPFFFSLYKGPLGIALLSADMAAPEWACMPLFETEGWRE